ncbi:phosphoribosylformylglycinamidine synthase subunit PurS [Helicobacter apodemus]|uniref:Phosphoribosylformylglycinamidine synthase subunit PurS n=1 Tax=Helicobacter apodemus TaxID=135569 RepID=A0A4U8UIN2_9HELI|nr:phosphoribosylformylglycinamidine synthase subunit PurS [Helicobacter apodemus]TLE17269.1 phosphoribosylformylglycinamidine synthase subunit PurS [Helicobacter apodemus]
MRVEVIVRLKNGVLDPQGKAIHNALESLGHTNIQEVNVGKAIILEIDSKEVEEVKKQVHLMCDTLLANTVIEDYQIKL